MAETWTPIDDPTAFQDDAVFEIDEKTKSIQVLVEQPIVAGESKSQFIKFQMGRYYDAIDLTQMEVNILYESPTGYQDISSAVNREYSDEYIRFGWLVPYAACSVKGALGFAVEFVGEDYVLKTTRGSTPVLDSIAGSSSVPEPVEQTWYIELQSQVAAAINNANSTLEAVTELVETFQGDIGEAISDWLDARPEATTTVQDGSITEAKLADDLYSAYASTGANLFEPSLNSMEINGLTYTFDPEEKTYRISGTATANTYIYLGIFTIPAGQYKLIAMTEQGTGDTFRVNLYNQTTSQLIAQDFGSGRVFTLTEETRCRLAPYINSGATLDTVIKPMITTRLRATVDDYAPYLYGKTRLDLNVSALKYDLYKSKLNGDKTNNVNTGWLYDVAKDWIDNASHIFYGYNNNLFWDVTLATDNKYPLTCSVFACAMILGIKFTDSKYNGLPSNISTELGYKDDVLIDKMRGDFISHHLAKYFIEKGFAFIPVEGLKNVHTGDVLFYNLEQDDAPDFFMSIDHTAVFAYPVSDTTYYVWEVGDNSGPHLASKQYASNDVVLVARPPYNVSGESKRRITLSTQDFTGPVALASIFSLTHGYSANMWKVYLMGPAYGKGVSASSVYLIRTNGNGVVSEKIALFEGTGSSVRKLDENYNIIDSGGYYNQPVTILVEWLG